MQTRTGSLYIALPGRVRKVRPEIIEVGVQLSVKSQLFASSKLGLCLRHAWVYPAAAGGFITSRLPSPSAYTTRPILRTTSVLTAATRVALECGGRLVQGTRTEYSTKTTHSRGLETKRICLSEDMRSELLALFALCSLNCFHLAGCELQQLALPKDGVQIEIELDPSATGERGTELSNESTAPPPRILTLLTTYGARASFAKANREAMEEREDGYRSLVSGVFGVLPLAGVAATVLIR